jgi:alpha-glucosidase (family GH31 glycosyl hydrolase)
VLSWFYPVIPQAGQAKLMPEVKPAELPVLHMSDPWQHVDFSNPNALELFRRWWKHRLDVGVAGSMVDFGDRVTEDAQFWDGKRGDEMHNFYSYDYHRTCSEVFHEKRGDDFILFGRAAAPGTQKWVAQFAGDHASNFKALRGVMTGALNLCACGFSTWGSDLGGFLGWPEPTVYMRWTQFGCFSPLMRCHGRTAREPWNYGDAAVANYKYYAWVRENLLDYIYNSAVEAHETGVPLMRSLAVAFPDETALATNGDEYMFGRDLLVAPVVDERDSRTICFPAGTWTSLWDGKSVAGPADSEVDVPPDRIPVYLRAGAVVPVELSAALEFGGSMTGGRVKVLVVTPPKTEEASSVRNEKGGSTEVALKLVTGGFDMALKNAPDTGYVLIYGTGAREVRMNGEVLSKMEDGGAVSVAGGWFDDSRINRVVVRLPAGTDKQMEVEF